ncbi:MAG: hypothetical protein U9Q18_03240 [Caldisericota bacterium]|nr:hypothetical protein [Caldisericota bacterium]
MANTKHASDRVTKSIRLIARIWSIPVIVYALVLVVGYTVNWITTGVADPYAVENYPFIENLSPIFMLLAILGLGIAWRKEKLGGIINLFFCCLAIIPIFLIRWPITQNIYNIIPFILIIIVAFPGILFLIYWWRSKKRIIPQNSA